MDEGGRNDHTGAEVASEQVDVAGDTKARDASR